MLTVVTVVNFIMFYALLPIAFLFIRKAYKVGKKKDYTRVALKRGESPKNPQKYAKVTVGINLVAGLVLLGLFIYIQTIAIMNVVILSNSDFTVLGINGITDSLSGYFNIFDPAPPPYELYRPHHFITWTSIAGVTIIMRFIAEFIVSRQAHLGTKK